MKIYVSVVPLILEYLKPGGIENVLKIAEKAELSGIQLVPLRGLSTRVLKRIPKEKVIAYEGSWHDSKKFLDIHSELLFGSMKRVRRVVQKFHHFFPEAMAIDVPEIPGSLTEISPVNGDWELNFLTAPNGCVYDTKHIDQEPKVTDDKVAFVQRLIDNESIKLIHFQTRDIVDLGHFLAPATYSNVGLNLKIALRAKVPVVIEFPPSFLLKKPVDMLARIRDKIYELEEQQIIFEQKKQQPNPGL